MQPGELGLLAAVMLAAAVEFVEAFTIVLAMGAGVVLVQALGAVALATGVGGPWLPVAIGLGLLVVFALPLLRLGRSG